MSISTIQEVADKVQARMNQYERMGETADIVECLYDLRNVIDESGLLEDDVYREWKQKYVIDRERHLWERRNK